MEAIRKATVTFSESSRLIDDLTCVALKIEEPELPLARAEMEIRSDLKELAERANSCALFAVIFPRRSTKIASAGRRAGGH